MSSPLFYACEGGHEEFATFLLDNGAEVDAKNHNGVTALFIAAQVGAASVVRLLMARGADPNLRSTRDHVLPLYVACFEGHLDVVKELLLFHNVKEREEQGTRDRSPACGGGSRETFADAHPVDMPAFLRSLHMHACAHVWSGHRRVGAADEHEHGECGWRGRRREHSADGQL